MKKTALTIMVLGTLYLVLSTSVRAQAFDFNKAYQDYQYNLSLYNQDFTNYQGARDFYLKNPTLTLKEDARIKTLIMLRERDELMKVYLTAVRMKIVETNGLSTDQKNSVFGKIDAEVAWYINHKVTYLDSDPLENLFGKSSESESRYKTNTSLVIYEGLFDISLGQEEGLRSNQETIYRDLRSIIDQEVATGKLDINPFNRWFTDIENVIQNLKQNEVLSQTDIQKLYSENYVQPKSVFSSSINPLASSVALLSQLNGFLTEVAVSIQNQMQ